MHIGRQLSAHKDRTRPADGQDIEGYATSILHRQNFCPQTWPNTPARGTKAKNPVFTYSGFGMKSNQNPNNLSQCMSNNRSHFENFCPIHSQATVGGIKGGLAIKGEGVFVFKLKDDDGQIHTIWILNSLYLPDLQMCLLSPQHWAQEANNNAPTQWGTQMENYANSCRLLWQQATYSKTIPFDPITNTPVF